MLLKPSSGPSVTSLHALCALNWYFEELEKIGNIFPSHQGNISLHRLPILHARQPGSSPHCRKAGTSALTGEKYPSRRQMKGNIETGIKKLLCYHHSSDKLSKAFKNLHFNLDPCQNPALQSPAALHSPPPPPSVRPALKERCSAAFPHASGAVL